MFHLTTLLRQDPPATKTACSSTVSASSHTRTINFVITNIEYKERIEDSQSGLVSTLEPWPQCPPGNQSVQSKKKFTHIYCLGKEGRGQWCPFGEDCGLLQRHLDNCISVKGHESVGMKNALCQISRHIYKLGYLRPLVYSIYAVYIHIRNYSKSVIFRFNKVSD